MNATYNAHVQAMHCSWNGGSHTEIGVDRASAISGGSEKGWMGPMRLFLLGVAAFLFFLALAECDARAATPSGADTACSNAAARTGPAARLPDCRAYEMVTPVAKGGSDVIGVNDLAFYRAAYEQSSASGEAITYSSGVSFGDQAGGQNANQYIASRTSSGWTTTGINAPIGRNLFFPNVSQFTGAVTPFMGFSEDLSSAWLVNETKLTSDALEGFLNLYKRNNANGSLEALTIGTPSALGFSPGLELEFKGASADGDDSVFSATAALTPNAAPGGLRQIYDFSNGELHLVSVLPDGTANPDTSNVGMHNGVSQYRTANIFRAVSADGSRIFWTSGGDSNGFFQGTGGEIYVRENPTQAQSALSGGKCSEPAKACTVAVSGSVTASDARFQTASSDGSEAVFQVLGGPQQGDLYRFDVASETPTLVAHETYGVAGASEDLSHLYFVSAEDLAPGATAGQPNLYLDHDGIKSFIATLPAAELANASQTTSLGSGNSAVVGASPIQTSSRVTPDGRHLVFQTSANPTGYDNRDVESGEPAVEVYLYDANAHRLTCISCNPSGARPQAAELRAAYAAGIEESILKTETTAAAWIPTWEHPLHPSRLLSTDGNRVFFNSYDALIPRDTNGKQDVYEWEAQGVGTCGATGGCVNLISSGESARASEFVDASLDGRDVFIRTESSFDPRDLGLLDIYDARVNGGFAIPPSPPPCVGDACQNLPAAPSDPTPASASFHGAGNQATPKAVRRGCQVRNPRSGKGKKAKQKMKKEKQKAAKGCVRAKGKTKKYAGRKTKKHARRSAKR